ncbi:MAG: polyribonucleotide nucleotidyltransferase, partial [Candidatus Atribacteria bacterium]|nr:polyribonucleotide nucleotidyltransferase [Candidatus Atribacteria bacterium]MCD6350376.1 polyribonucleotide nucleotidyltransferase [Candidatus Atribacteria bacterium]
MIHTFEIPFGRDQIIIVESGKLAKQAGGAVTVRYGDTVVLVTATASDQPREAIDFTPLVVDFEERFYAAGKIPGGFIKREGRPRNTAILSARLIDRSIRPLFPPLFYNDIQVVTTVLSVDELHPPEVISIIGASVALGISGVPFAGPLGACRLGIIGNEIILNPTLEELNESRLDLALAASSQGITMIEAGGKEVSEEEVVKSLHVGYQLIQQIIKEQQEIIKRIGKPKQEVKKPEHFGDLENWLRDKFLSQIQTTITIPEKSAREKEMKALLQKALQECEEEFATLEGFTYIWEKIVKEEINQLVLKTGRRQDGRTPKEIRPISCEVGLLPRTHGSALFTRGQTQVLAITTLGATSEEQKVDGLQEEEAKRFMLHYNFPPYSTGEVRPLRGPGRREIGHGALAERALECFIPPEEEFPYTIRVVSEVLESNGSSSMATVCGGSLSLMDAGVPIRTSCAGISIGLMFGENNDYVLLRDILGSEDHYGEMDFKVAGSKQGITAIQLDVKNPGLPVEIFAEAIQEARESRLYILDIMDSVLPKPRSSVSKYAPRIATITISTDKIGALIGPGGKVIKKIIEETGATIDIKEDGRVIIFSKTEEGKERAIEMIKAVTQDVEVGKIYLGKVTKTTDFGAFVELFPGREGLCHISQLSQERIRKVEDFVKVGDDLLVKVIGIDSLGRINLSHKEA